MGIQTMGSQGGGDTNGKQSQFQPLVRQNSMYSLTLDEVQNQLGDLGKPLSSMNLDELLKNVWTAEANQSICMDIEGAAQASQTALQRQASLSLTGALSKKTVDEVWRDIQQNKNNEEKKSRERQPTLGEMTLEDFLVKAGVVAEASSDKKNTGPVVATDSNVAAPQFPEQGQWIQYPQPQYQHPQQNLMGIYMPGHSMAQPLHMGAGSALDVPFAEIPVALPSPVMGPLSDTQTSGRKRGTPEDMIEKTVERRQKRMIKNRESAARSRARKQAYTHELENKVARLEEENELLRKRKELESMLPCAPPPEPKYQLRRTTSAPF
ncbi:ABSCISIC ACID-INSENSITIVE 5-like protein 2 [Neltuma alba]|uniref:ABSCISIC ACID-INSENSITIVE 5-like protein 2 n=1 Tax=Neltuma alba TaxID=207710 RepID=UPI0010A46165|nr:ABSCISIC ACID-INSENSITIVE 5-like protein 2 [Prosopis alba]XP_028802608.1 ABSCISIC ACID-INSENSITIVE 5-like protein 2 [Prosopis alba]